MGRGRVAKRERGGEVEGRGGEGGEGRGGDPCQEVVPPPFSNRVCFGMEVSCKQS